MDSYTRFHKTGKGLAEIEDDALKLSTEERQLLILIDGTRTVGDIQLLLPAVSDHASLFRQLLLESLITTGGPVTATATPASPAVTTWPETPPGTPQHATAPALSGAEAELERLRAMAQAASPPTAAQPPTAAAQAPVTPAAATPVAAAPAAVTSAAVTPAAVTPAAVTPAALAAPLAPTPAITDHDTNVIDVAEIGLQITLLQDKVLREAREVFDHEDIELLAPKIQACETLSELTILSTRLRDIVESYADTQTADRFLIRIRKILTV